MAKDKITEYDATAANNTVVGDVNLAENSALPSDMNNAVREVMSHQKEAFGSGTPLYVDQTNNRVGVNNSAPSTALEVDADGATVLTLDRATSHGDIVEVQKDGTRFGALGSQSSGFYIDGESGHSGLRFANGAVTPREDLADADNSNDLGASNNRWANLYLGGGAYIGGTGSANHLDDYEYGVFDPDLGCDGTNFSSRTISSRAGYYEKVGNAVSVYIYFELSAFTLGSGSGNMQITGLPFSASTARAGAGGSGGVAFHGVNVGSTVYQVMPYASGSTVYFLVSRDQDSWVNVPIGDIHSGTIFAVHFQLNYYVS